MKRIFLFLPIWSVLFFSACRNDDSYKPDDTGSAGEGAISMALTTRVGTAVDGELTQYVKSLNLLLFRENAAGDYVLYRNELLTKAQLNALTDGSGQTDAGFTKQKEFTFDSVPIANYRIVGVGNVADSIGRTVREVSLQGVVPGNTMDQVLAVVADGNQATRLFLGMTDVVRAGATASNPPVLRMYRKVSMFALTLLKIPSVVNQITMQVGNTYGSFNMDGGYTPGSDITVDALNTYNQQVQDSITLSYVTLPTSSGDSSTFQTTFYLIDGPKQIVNLPRYVLKPNTITKVTATVDTDQAGNIWKVDIGTIITVDVEWNVDQEPPITI